MEDSDSDRTEDEAAAEDEAPAGGLAERTEALDGEANSDATAPNSDSDATGRVTGVGIGAERMLV